MNRYKKKGSGKKNHIERKEGLYLVKMSNLLNLAVAIRTLYMVEGWRAKRLARYMESYLVLMEEIADKRTTVAEFIADTEALTGINVEKLLN